MMRAGFAYAVLATLLLAHPGNANAATTNTMFVSRAPSGTLGTDAGIDVSTGGVVRISASGTLRTTGGACGPNLTPDGCARAFSLTREANAPVGVLLAAFSDRGGRLLSAWMGRSVSAGQVTERLPTVARQGKET